VNDATPVAAPEETIDNNGTPLGNSNQVCWVHWWILLDMVLFVIYGIVCIARRRHEIEEAKFHEQDEDEDMEGKVA